MIFTLSHLGVFISDVTLTSHLLQCQLPWIEERVQTCLSVVITSCFRQEKIQWRTHWLKPGLHLTQRSVIARD